MEKIKNPLQALIRATKNNILFRGHTRRTFQITQNRPSLLMSTKIPAYGFCNSTCSKSSNKGQGSQQSNWIQGTPTTVIEHQDFYIEQHFTSCLAEYAYYIESKGEAIIIDPLRETKPYLDIAARRGTKIKYILESHFHADFVSGHISLASKTGAKIIYGPTAKANYEIYVAKDEEQLKFGDATIQVLHTPGHTMESSCFVLKDKQGKAHSVYTGDTLFLGEVGRPDLAVKSGEITEKDLAGWLFDSLHNKLMKLPNEVLVFPSHGAGSACGKNIGKGHVCDIAGQKQKNYALQPMAREDFIKLVTFDLPKPPTYFFHDASMNKTGYANLEDASIKDFNAIPPSQLSYVIETNQALILDCRNSIESGFIDGSLNIGLNTPFAVWVGALINPETPLVILADNGNEEEAASRLMRIGFDKIIGYVQDGFSGVLKEKSIEIVPVSPLSNEDFVKITKDNENYILDIRSKAETQKGIASNAANIPLGELTSRLGELPKDKTIFIYCQSGARSKMAVTLLKRNGVSNVEIAALGFPALSKAGMDWK